jgi:hypothetical protein
MSIGDPLAMRQIFEQILGRPVDLVYGGLRPGRDDDIRREAVLLWSTAGWPSSCSRARAFDSAEDAR